MKFSAEVHGLDGLGRALSGQAARDGGEALLRAAAEELRREAIQRLADAGDMTEAEAARFVRVEPPQGGAGYGVVADAPEAWTLEFGARGRPGTSWFTRALAAALPAMKRAIARGRTLRGGLR